MLFPSAMVPDPNIVRSRPRLVMAALLAILLASCTPTPVVERFDEAELLDERIAFLTDGETTREDVLLRLGEPTGSHEDGRILTYVMHVDTLDGSIDPGHPRFDAPTTLDHVVLVFGPDDRLVRHSVVGTQ